SLFVFSVLLFPPLSTLFPYTTLFRSVDVAGQVEHGRGRLRRVEQLPGAAQPVQAADRRSGEVHAALEFREHTREDLVHVRRLDRSEEHTSELQSPYDLVCRLLLEKKN